jgi:glycosyltransferase 2 family protein
VRVCGTLARVGEWSQPVTREHRLSLLKTLPGLLISGFFLWFTFVRRNKQGIRPVNLDDFRAIHLIAPMWIVGVVLFSVAGYTVRSYRSWFMLRSVKARFYDCARVLMTSLAANNILPLRIGDVMRIFTYSGDLNATPSIIMSTVLLEKLLDVLTLGLMFVVAMQSGYRVEPHLRLVAEVCVGLSFMGVLVLVFGARTLEPPVKRLFARTRNEKLAKVEHWILLALECIRQIGVPGTLWLVAVSFVAWICEGMLYLSAAQLVGLRIDWAGPWAAVSQANLSFLIPSSPGGIGPFEWACKDALIKHMPAGANVAPASIFGLLIHAWLFIGITGVGGGMFLAHRARRVLRKPLFEEIDTLPAELP